MCTTALPALVTGNYDSFDQDSVRLVHTRTLHIDGDLDQACGPGKFYVLYENINATYNLRTCERPQHWCPNPTIASQCPCVDPSSELECKTLPCFE